MLNKNDPLIGAVQDVMKRSQSERDAVKLVNEKFGVTDRKALPREKQGEWDAAYKSVLTEGLHPNQQKLDVHEPEKDELTKKDFEMLRAKKKPMEESDVTSPSSMGISKPDYASGTPDYANKGPQMVNRAAKTSMPAGTVNKSLKEAVMNKIMKKLEEKKMTDAEMAKREEIVKSMKKGMAGFKKRYGERAKDVMYATATKQAMKEDNEGFNNRHGLSVNASAEKQAVAEQVNLNLKTPGIGPKSGQRSVISRSGNKMNMSNVDAVRLRNDMINRLKAGDQSDMRTPADYARQGLVANTGRKLATIGDKGVRRPISGTNDPDTRLSVARAEAERRRRAGEPVLKAADVPGVNAKDIQSKSDEVMAASKMDNRSDLAKKAKDLRAGTNTFAPKPPAVLPSKTPEERAQQARDAIARLNKRQALGSTTTTPPVTTAATTTATTTPPVTTAATTTPPVTTAATTTPPVTTAATTVTPASAPVPASAPAQTPVRQVAPEAPKKRTAFQDMMRRSQAKNEPAGTPGRRY